MEKNIKNAIENYQCPGCSKGSDISCFEVNPNGGAGCGSHRAGTFITGLGAFFLGMPKGFCRVGSADYLKPMIYNKFDDSHWEYSKFNIPVWKYLNENGHTLIRGVSPRTNSTFIHIFLEDCMDKFTCLEITKADIDAMD